MDGIHDMGGMQGWGTVTVDPDEPVFREWWHGRAFAMGAMSMGLSGTNLDAFRHGLERLHPYDYLADGYYGRWLACAETLLVDSGVIPPGAVEARARNLSGESVDEPADVEENKPVYERGGAGSLREIDDPHAFSVGDEVRAKDIRTGGHTRMPGYIRGRTGTVHALRPAALLPDTNAHFAGENPQHVYTVEFDSTELWGPDAEAAKLRIDLFESYLEAT
ncbi:MAG: nitrile hydratase subunit beta [Acidimicrobiaceae bacterium]|nr:nitrile hydratase subunit beta [Acidimicrobiaceae bacterium]MCY3642655.1 nitrile hydratase subunit beta [Acidimicrobiaceae bacterium]MDE0495415.1 nitrile hydratase subunit beta [Acidimicrobiaceae bacterium]MXY12284.1 nitrile hydratase subunit beta [Acidimicrobiaceae bacterium]MXZ66484.1 nitrile hydratase subunit beta [Acidimicrobiaceae bacterium]